MKVAKISISESKKEGFTKEWLYKLNNKLCFITDKKKVDIAGMGECTLVKRANTIFFNGLNHSFFWVPTDCLINERGLKCKTLSTQ